MMDHAELMAEMATVDKMPIGERMKLAKNRRATQLKTYFQFEKQSGKDRDHTKKKKTEYVDGIVRRKPNQLRFADNILILDAAAKNDLVEGNAAEFCVSIVVCAGFQKPRCTQNSNVS